MKKKVSDEFLIGRSRDIGGIEVKRVLPYSTRQMIGPFIFFDQMGRNEFLTDGGILLHQIWS